MKKLLSDIKAIKNGEYLDEGEVIDPDKKEVINLFTKKNFMLQKLFAHFDSNNFARAERSAARGLALFGDWHLLYMAEKSHDGMCAQDAKHQKNQTIRCLTYSVAEKLKHQIV